MSDMRASSSRFDERARPQCPDGARGTQGTCDALWPAGGRHTSGTSFRSTSVSSMLRYSSFPAARGSDSRQRQFAALSASTNANGIPERKRQGWRQAALHGAVILALPMGASCVGPPNWMGRTPPHTAPTASPYLPRPEATARGSRACGPSWPRAPSAHLARVRRRTIG